MQIADITREAGRERPRKRVGRGRSSGHGKTSTRGTKGAGARAGVTKISLSEGGQMPMFRQLPKRGFSNANFRKEFCVVNVADLEARFKAGEHVTGIALVERGLARNLNLPVKILGTGDLKKKLTVDAAAFSKSAEEKIKAAGGEARVVG